MKKSNAKNMISFKIHLFCNGLKPQLCKYFFKNVSEKVHVKIINFMKMHILA